MARNISLPVQFTFSSRRVRWIRGRINLLSLSRDLGTNYVLVSVSSPPKYRGLKQTIPREFLPAQIRSELPARGRIPLAPGLRRLPVEILLCLPERDDLKSWDEPERIQFDPWQCRREFLSLKGTTDELLTFLNQYGAWSEGLAHRVRGSQLLPTIVFEVQLWIEQGNIREILKRGAHEWLEGRKSLRFSSRSEYPYYVHVDSNCFSAIETSITIDFLLDTTFQPCARKDCGNSFPADRKGKRYCQQYCAHLVSVRKNRKSSAKRKGV
jgi:hypothetical protein